MKKLLRFFWVWGPVIFWGGLIYYLSSRTLPNIGQTYWQDWWFKNLSHVFMFGALGFLFYRALNFKKEAKNYTLPFIFSFCYALSDELHQSFVPGREAWWGDVGFDTLGIITSLLLINFINSSCCKNSKNG